MLVGDTAEHDIRVETNDLIAVFTNRGARLKSWRLKHYLTCSSIRSSSSPTTSATGIRSPSRCRRAMQR